MKLTFRAEKIGGKIQIENRAAFDKAVEGLLEGKEVMISIDTDPSRTSSQLAYYWGVVLPVFIDEAFKQHGLRQTKKACHDILKRWYAEDMNETMPSLAEASVKDAQIFIDWAIGWINDTFNSQIPEARK